MTRMEKLLSCPFCGNTIILVETAAEIEGIDENDGYYQVGSKSYAAICCMDKKGCGATGGYRQTRDDAAVAWNRRAQRRQPNEPLTLEELREMDGEPVWAECLIQGSLSCWGYRDEDGVCGYCATFSDDDYGGYWLAYRRKPESEVSPVTNFGRITAAPESLNQCDFCTNPMKNLAGSVVGCDGNCQFEDGVPQNITNSGPAAPSENWEAQVIRDLARQGVSYQDTQAALDIIRQLKQKEKKGENHGERI